MKKVYGWTGKTLRIDLTTGKNTIENWDYSWIGGRGFGQWPLFNEEPVDAEDFDPRSVLIFSSGSLSGTMAPSSSRLGISSRNIITNGCSYSSSGGFFASEMKYAGYDHIIISGKAVSPIYILIQNDDVKILDAAHLWGKTTWETESMLRHHHSDPRLSVACVGPAGENLVRFSCIMVDRNRAAGWGGNGALMGSKKLKAIAIRGTKPIYIAHPDEFLQSVQQARRKLEQAPSTKSLREGGTLNAIGKSFNPLTYRNYQDDVWEEEKHPWLVTEKQAIRNAVVELNLPFLGFCLGHQLLADALGGKVGKMSESEVGILDVVLTDDGQQSTLFSGLQKNIKSLQWHGAEVTEAPPRSLILAESPACAIQALQYGESAFSMQCHIELIDSTVSDWGKVPEYEQSLEKTLGPGSLDRLNIEAEKYMTDFNNSAKIIYNNFIAKLK